MNYKKRLKLLAKLSRTIPSAVKPSDEQLLYINHALKHDLFIEACPGSGKTEVIGLKAAHEIAKWSDPLGGLAILTFTQSAAKELNLRISKHNRSSASLFPHYIGTFDSWLHSFLFQPFSHKILNFKGRNDDKSIEIIEADSTAGFLNSFELQFRRGRKLTIIKANEYYKSKDEKLVGLTDNAKSFLIGAKAEELIALWTLKKKFLKAGFATYSDAEFLCCYILDNYDNIKNSLAKKFPVIIVDECQDLSQSQIHIINILKEAGTKIHLIGDLNQAIYEFRNVNPQDIFNYINENGFKTHRLTHNYRSNQQIVNLASKLVTPPFEIIGHQLPLIPQACLLWTYTPDTVSELSDKFLSKVLATGLNPAKCAILARGKTTLSELSVISQNSKLTKVELMAKAISLWGKKNKSTEDTVNALTCMGKAICYLGFYESGQASSYFCPRTHNQIEWRLLIKFILDSCIRLNPYNLPNIELTYREWIPRLKQRLQELWPSLSGLEIKWENTKNKLRSPDKLGDTAVSTHLAFPRQTSKIKATTIHSVKGETLDAVLLVSHKNKRSSGGHFSHWIREGNFEEEHIRFAYVACSRPKHLLIIAIQEDRAEEKAKLISLGLVESD